MAPAIVYYDLISGAGIVSYPSFALQYLHACGTGNACARTHSGRLSLVLFSCPLLHALLLRFIALSRSHALLLFFPCAPVLTCALSLLGRRALSEFMACTKVGKVAELANALSANQVSDSGFNLIN
jgi:hypothetical protein